MTLPVPYIVYGTITDINDNALSSADIKCSGNSSETYATDTTSATGEYSVNIQDYASDGDTVTVTVTYGAKSSSDSFVLTLGDTPSKEIDISFDIRDLKVKINKVPGKKVYINKVQDKKVYIVK